MSVTLTAQEKAAAVVRMRETADSIRGPGMGTSIRSDELDALIEALDASQAEVARLKKKEARRSGAKGKAAAVAEEAALAELIPALADILESHAELWGTAPLSAIEAWCQQNDIPLPDAWVEALNRALGGGH